MIGDTTKYCVWKRSDGYVGCTVREPRGWKYGEVETTFEVLKWFEFWDGDTYDYIIEQRKIYEMAPNKN